MLHHCIGSCDDGGGGEGGPLQIYFRPAAGVCSLCRHGKQICWRHMRKLVDKSNIGKCWKRMVRSPELRKVVNQVWGPEAYCYKSLINILHLQFWVLLLVLSGIRLVARQA
eukprot:8677301-Karenia_brevis.AAC.1